MLLGMAPVLLMDKVDFLGAVLLDTIAATSISTEDELEAFAVPPAAPPLLLGAFALVLDISLLDEALAELSVLEAILAALGCDKSLEFELPAMLPALAAEAPEAAAPSPSDALLSGMT